MNIRLLPCLIVLLLCSPLSVSAKDVITQRSVGMELARDLAQAAVDVCRERGWQVTAVVVNRAGDVQALLRDSLASRTPCRSQGRRRKR